MQCIEIPLSGCYEMTPSLYKDARGYFFEAFNKKTFKDNTGLDFEVVQENQSKSLKGTIRALHFQKGAAAQAKLVRVLAGEILDVVVDIRPASATYGHYHSLLISADNLKQLFIPKGFAHGFSVLSESATIVYACDAPYNKEAEGGIYYADPTLNINWQLGQVKPILSEKDMLLPFLRDAQL